MKVVVVGAGIVGAACASHAVAAGFGVTVLHRGPVGAGTTSRGRATYSPALRTGMAITTGEGDDE
ncbi:FAD-dependent oxidoreductase [Streptomyces sp. NPDC057592]